jgi:hypothetical protein
VQDLIEKDFKITVDYYDDEMTEPIEGTITALILDNTVILTDYPIGNKEDGIIVEGSISTDANLISIYALAARTAANDVVPIKPIFIIKDGKVVEGVEEEVAQVTKAASEVKTNITNAETFEKAARVFAKEAQRGIMFEFKLPDGKKRVLASKATASGELASIVERTVKIEEGREVVLASVVRVFGDRGQTVARYESHGATRETRRDARLFDETGKAANKVKAYISYFGREVEVEKNADGSVAVRLMASPEGPVDIATIEGLTVRSKGIKDEGKFTDSTLKFRLLADGNLDGSSIGRGRRQEV